ncbi:hypothetical protein J2755_000671 [Methanohalophilus levihalophilus]|uniref:hypothetical protein n=1 Tax=Methanohalophilus levihalophilus TaxID=1431282 RepID=UPI001AE400FE|nr:hypothetical protein [Methanohalophilus levihalophilus]MBP2029751.1 hypothetical protein [Methanohalophilus levihalophilus]
MGFTTIAFYESRAGTTALSNVAGLEDTHVAVNGDNITVPPRWNQLIAAWGGMSNATDVLVAARLSSPSLRKTSLVDLANLEAIAAGGALQPSSPTPIDIFLQRAVQLVSGEFLNYLQASDGTTAANLCTAVVFLGDGNYGNPYAGRPIQTVRATSSTTLTANKWSACTLTLDQQLESGSYAIVGMRAQSAGAKAARLIMQETPARPGCIAYDSNADIEHPMFRNGNLGVWGTFVHTAIPQVEFLSLSADTSETVFLDIVKIG